MEAYCVKCRAKVEIQNMKEVVINTKHGAKKFAMGICPKCGTKVARVLGKA